MTGSNMKSQIVACLRRRSVFRRSPLKKLRCDLGGSMADETTDSDVDATLRSLRMRRSG